MKQSLKITWCFPLAMALLGLSAGCSARLEPTLCLLVGSDTGAAGGGVGAPTCDVDPAALDDAGLTDCPASVSDGAGFTLRHELPPGVAPIGTLQIHIDTPCEGADQDIEASHVDRVAIVNGVVPAGGQCGFSLSAVMANSDLRCDVMPQQPCEDVQSLCDAAPAR